jgi:PHD/YefM family antitoxin component YafN of YafNO toxin-antitoxin module
MVKYAQNELFSITDFTKQIGSAVGNIKEHTLEKIGILKNNRLEAVVISTDEYERLKALEESVALAEHSSIYHAIEKRKDTPLSEYISMDEMAKKFNIDLEKL